MKKLFEQIYDLRTSDFDKFNHIKHSSVLDLFQDAAGRHAEELGLGYDAMLERSYFWVLIKIKFQIIKEPAFHQKVVVKTWPLAPNKFIYRREYSIESESGEKLIVGSSEWVVMNSQKRRLVSAPDLYPFTDGFHPERNFEERLDRLDDLEPNASPYSIIPGFSEIDANGHVNNTKYANFVFDAINPDVSLETDIFQIDYKKEVMQGAKLNIYHIKKEACILAEGRDDEGNVMFSCKIECKEA